MKTSVIFVYIDHYNVGHTQRMRYKSLAAFLCVRITQEGASR